MKVFCILVFGSTLCGLVYGSQCSLGNVTEPSMQLASYYNSQAATSFEVSCDRAYNILFKSDNLTGTDGTSYVTNGLYRLKTKMSILGAGKNIWGVPFSHESGHKNKYVIAVQLLDQPFTGVPSGIYRDKISIYLMF